MMGLSITLGQIAEHFGYVLEGDPTCVIHSVATLKNAQSGQLSFLSNEQYTCYLMSTQASAVVLSAAHAKNCPVNALISDDAYLAYAKIASYLYPSPQACAYIAPSSCIATSVRIGSDVFIAEQVSIGEGVVIADHVQIGAGCVIESGVVIGAGSILKSGVTLCPQTIIGQNCVLQPGCVIGADGFGFANDSGAWVKIPQLGRVVIHDDVEVGANTTIDRGALEDTVIGQGVKLDNQIQIAHNVTIGKNTAIAACTGIAGSTRIGEGCTIAGNVGIVGHLVIADQVHISAKSLVTKSLTQSGYYSGNLPATSNKNWKRSIARIRTLDKLVLRVKAIEKALLG